jgi:hypothetical protein
MERIFTAALLILIAFGGRVSAQEIDTVFKKSSKRSIRCYGAVSNKFTKLNGDYANIVAVYGGIYLKHRLMLGMGLGFTTNGVPVPIELRAVPDLKLIYQYSQLGFAAEYVIGSNRTIILVGHLFTGAGFSIQHYHAYINLRDDDLKEYENMDDDWNRFFVTEPGVQAEINVFRWMRLGSGISYRAAFGSDSKDLSNKDLSNISYNATLKFGGF